MQKQKIEELFQNLTNETISKEVAKEIEDNLKSYFTTLVDWLQKEKEGEENE